MSILDPNDFSVWEKIFSVAGTAAASIVAAVGFVARRWAKMEDTVTAQERRITIIEENYVTKDTLRGVFDELQEDINMGFRDVNAGFARAHERMDRLFTEIGARQLPHGRHDDH